MATGPATLSAAAEAEILQGARSGGAGRRSAAERIARELREPLHAVCLHLSGRPDDALDALEEALAAVARGLPEFRGATRLTTWVYRVALRAALRVRARRTGRPPGVPSSEPGKVMEAHARLLAEPRAVLALFAVEGLPPAEVAAVLGIPEEAAWVRLRAARRALAAALAR